MTDSRSARKPAPKPPILKEVRLDGWAPKGSTETTAEGRRLLVDRGIPGERVVASVIRGRGPKRGVVETILEGSPNRIEPRCPHYREGCGGCQWQHMEYQAQVATKRAGVDREMESVGLDVRVEQAHAMDYPWRYRRTAAIAIGWEAGFRPRGRRGIVEIRDCPISHPSIGRLASDLNDLLRAGALPNYHGKVWLDTTVVGSDESPELQVVIQGISGLTLENNSELPDVAQTLARLDGVCTVSFRHREGDVKPLIGSLMNTLEVAHRPMYVPAGSFFQTNVLMLERVLDFMRKRLAGQTIRHAADIYGGVGTFGLPLSSMCEGMTLIELDRQSVDAARMTAEAWGVRNMIFDSRHAERALPDLPHLDLAIVDPPRSGLGATVVDAILVNRPNLVFYVSCAPASLARDLVRLQEGGYCTRSLEVFDFYPQTYHIESMVILEI